MRIAMCVLIFTLTLHAQGDWSGYGNDKGAQRYSPLTEINTGNVSKLVPAWEFSMKTDDAPFRPSQSIPLVIDGVMYLSWPFNKVAALDSANGRVLWQFTARSGFSGKLGSMRSLEYWPGTADAVAEILFGTEEGELYALNAKTGRPIPGFGDNGVVNLRTPEVMNGYRI